MKNKKFINFSVCFFALSAVFIPLIVLAAFVPCGTSYSPEQCSTCHIFVLIQNVLNYLWLYLAIPIAALMFVYGGFLLIVPGGIGEVITLGPAGEKSVRQINKGRKIIANTIVGLAIVFFAWLAIDTIIKVMGGQIASDVTTTYPFGPWNKIECKAAPAPQESAAGGPVSQAAPKPEITEAERLKLAEDTLLKKPTPAPGEIQKQAQSLLSKYPGSFSANADCGGGNHAEGTLKAVAEGKLPPVCSPSCDCRPGGVSGNINLSSPLLAGIDRALTAYEGRIKVESITTGKHSKNSRHYQGKAVDLVVIDPKLRYRELYAFFGGQTSELVQCELQGKSVIGCSGSIDHIHVEYK